MKNFKPLGIVLLFLIMGSLVFFFNMSGSVIGDGIAVYRTVLAGKPTTQGFVYIPFAKAAETLSFVNVGIDINGDGVIAGYDTSLGRQEEWLIVNEFPEIIPGEANRFAFRIVDPDFGVKPASGVAVLSATAFDGAVWPVDRVHKEKVTKAFQITSVVLDIRDAKMTLDPTGKLATGLGIPSAYAEGVIPVANVAPGAPAAPGDYYARHDGVPDQDQLWNECAPTAISNSFRWLAKKYGVEDHMPGGDTNDLIDELKGDVEWSDGVPHASIISGKQAFINRHELPFEAHQIGGEDDGDIVRKIYDEIEKGQAVEVWLAFYNASGSPAGAHLVTVVGAGRKGGNDVVTFTDPDTRGAPSRDMYKVEGGNFMPEYAPGMQTYIRFAYAQSPIPSLIDHTWVDPRANAGVVQVGGTQTLTPPEGDVTLGRSQFGFFSTSISHPGDHYVGETFPVHAMVYYTGKTRTVHFWDAAGTEQSWTHGAGKPWTLIGSFIGGGAVSPALLTDRPPFTSVSLDRFSVDGNFTCTAPGMATVAYKVALGWPRLGGDVPAGVHALAHGAEFDVTSDDMRVESPAFRCVAKPEAKKEESRVAAPAAFCPGFVEDPAGKEIDVLKAGDQCYPTLQFHQAQADKCDATHWHANAGSARSLTGSTWADPSGCGFGKVSQVAQGKVKLSMDQAAPFVESVPAH